MFWFIVAGVVSPVGGAATAAELRQVMPGDLREVRKLVATSQEVFQVVA